MTGPAILECRDTLSARIGSADWILVTSRGWLDRGVDALIGAMANPPRATLIPSSSLASLETLSDLWAQARSLSPPDLWVALGGGTVIDLTKALAACFANGGIEPVIEALRGDLQAIAGNTASIIAVPTVLGAGSELTATATIWNVDGRKTALEHESLRPQPPIYAIRALVAVPEQARIAGLADIYSHAMDSVWNRNATTDSLQLAETAILALRSHLDGSRDDRDWLSLVEASRAAGMAIDVTRTSLAHAVSYPLTEHFDLVHGLAAGFALPAIAELCWQERPDLLQPLTRAHQCEGDGLAARVCSMLVNIGARALIVKRIDQPALSRIAQEVLGSSRARNFPIELDVPQIARLCDRSYELLAAFPNAAEA